MTRFSDSLVRHGALPAELVRIALGRQIVYGGALDTALLEMGALDEATVWGELSRASGLPIPEPALVESADPTVGALFDLGRSKRCRAVPVARRGDTLQVFCGEPIEAQPLREASAELGLDLELFVVPEVRLKVAVQAVYGHAVPPRFLRLLARLLGAEPVRRWAEIHAAHDARMRRAAAGETPSGAETPSGGDEAGTFEPTAAGGEDDETLFRAAADPDGPGRLAALRQVRRRKHSPLAQELAATFREDASFGAPEKALPAVNALGELRDARAVVLLVGLVKSEDAALAHAAQHALVQITKQNFGASRRRWTAWWQEHGHEQRTDWLFEGLVHKVAEIRESAAEELRELSGEYFGYHFDLPAAERDEARRRWQAWWDEKAAAHAAAAEPPT